MYELNGQQYTLEQVQNAADQSNLSLDEYIAKAEKSLSDTEVTSNTERIYKPKTEEPEPKKPKQESFGIGTDLFNKYFAPIATLFKMQKPAALF